MAMIFETAPGDDERIFVGEEMGFIWLYDRDGTRNPEPFLNLTDRIDLNPEAETRGLLAMTFHPDFQDNHKFYINLVRTDVETLSPSQLIEFKTDEENPDVADLASERLILAIDVEPDQAYCYCAINDVGFATIISLLMFFKLF